jgi:mRNA interferase HigB
MRINNQKALSDFKATHPRSVTQLDAWQAEVGSAVWKSPHDLKHSYRHASILKKRNVVFNICGNKYRLWAQISYQSGVVLVRAVGTHKDYDNWDVGKEEL